MKTSIIIMLLFSSSLTSQNLFEIGNKWIFDFYVYESNINPNLSVATTLTLEANRDTVINNNTYTILKTAENHQCRIFTDGEIVRDFAGKIYKYIPTSNTEVFLYDYNNLGIYDIEYAYENSPIFQAEVVFDSIGFDQSFNGIDLEIQYSKIIGNNSYDDDHAYRFKKDIGFKHVLPDLGTGLCDPSTANIIGDMRCFVAAQSDTIYFTQFNCSETVVEVKNSTKNLSLANEINVYPNPNNGAFNIEGEFDEVSAFNMIGQEIFLERNDNNFKILSTIHSAYLLRIRIGGEYFFRKILLD